MSAFDKILAALEQTGMKTKHTKGQSIRSQCPTHHSTGLTLSMRRREDVDGVSLKCFAGCDGADILRDLGLELRDLYDEPGKTSADYVPRVLTPWEEAMARLGIHNPPPIEHVLRRMEVEAIKEGVVLDG